jgi:hypothetical protein
MNDDQEEAMCGSDEGCSRQKKQQVQRPQGRKMLEFLGNRRKGSELEVSK